MKRPLDVMSQFLSQSCMNSALTLLHHVAFHIDASYSVPSLVTNIYLVHKLFVIPFCSFFYSSFVPFLQKIILIETDVSTAVPKAKSEEKKQGAGMAV